MKDFLVCGSVSAIPAAVTYGFINMLQPYNPTAWLFAAGVWLFFTLLLTLFIRLSRDDRDDDRR